MTKKDSCMSQPQLLLAQIREQFWSISGRNIAHNSVLNYVKCRFKCMNVQPNLPFFVLDIDYAGLFLVKDRNGHGTKRI